jgi:hypothetical protein
VATGSYYFLPSDIVSGDTPSVETGTAATGYEATYLTDFSDANRQRPAKLTSTTGAWLRDFGAAQRIDAVMLWHNYDAALANVKVQGNAANSWGAPTLSTTVVPPTKLGDGSTVKIFVDLRSVAGYSASGFRYWRFVNTTANSVNVGLKVMGFSTVRSFATAKIKAGLKQPKHRSLILLPTEFDPGAWAYNLQVGWREFQGDLIASSTDRTALDFWFDASGGGANLSVLVPEPDDATQGVMLFRFATTGDGLVDATRELERQPPGLNFMRINGYEVTAGGPEWT